MLSSPNKSYVIDYINLTPLPTTLDAKQSPLALLAQTCSQIGADAPNSKLLQSAEKSSKSSKLDTSKEKSSTANDLHHKSANHSTAREKSRSPEERSNSGSTGSRVRTPTTSKSTSSSNMNGRCASNQSAASPRASPAASERKTPASESTSAGEQTNSKSSERCSPATPTTSSTKTAFTPNILTSSSDPALKDLPLGTFKPGVPVSSSFLHGYAGGFPLAMDLMTSSFMSQHHAMKAGGFSPFLNYSRMKAESMPSVCRDPYCNCSGSSHLLGGGVKTSAGCPAGCTQCDHTKPPTSTSYLSHNAAAAAYAHAQLTALAAVSHLPFICNWVSGDSAYCGKRFSSSEELLAHLRTHTSGVVSESSLSMLSSGSLPPTHPLLHRTYPTPPLSPLATARYHPYSKPSLLPPSLTSSLTGFPLSHPGLSPYLPPYSLYGPRLGAAPGMHP